MPKKVTKAKRDECIRLRVHERLSTPVIARRVGISNFSVYRILKKHPWTGDKIVGGKRGTWLPEEIATLKKLWPIADREEIEAALPRRKWGSIGHKASELNIKRRLPGARKNKRPIPGIIVQLRQIREQRGMTRAQLSKMTGYHVMQFHQWEMGKATPLLRKLTDWCNALGFEMVLAPQLTESISNLSPLSKDKLMSGR